MSAPLSAAGPATPAEPAGARTARSAAQLRHDFDQSFAQAPQEAAQAQGSEDYLAIRLGADAHALRLAEIAALAPLAALTRVPGPCPELLGLIGSRGRLVPVYDLRALLGYAAPALPRSATGGPPGTPGLPRWQVVLAAQPVALAFDSFEGHLRLPRQAATAGSGPTHRHVHEVLHAGPAGVRPIVSLASVLEVIRVAARVPGHAS